MTTSAAERLIGTDPNPTRTAHLLGTPQDVGDASELLGRVLQYLPGNYKGQLSILAGELTIVIVGKDNAGWTLDGYVIPRLASGNLFATEVN